MDRCCASRSLVALGAIALAALPVRAAADEALIDKGRQLAEQHCIRCHVVRDDSPFSGIASTPSFRLLVTALPDWHERFETFYQRRPHPAIVRFRGVTPPSEDEPPSPTVNLMLEDVEAIVAYAENLYEKYEGEGDAMSAGQGPDPMLDAGSGRGPAPDAGLGPGPGPGPGSGSGPGLGPGSDSGGGPATRPAW